MWAPHGRYMKGYVARREGAIAYNCVSAGSVVFGVGVDPSTNIHYVRMCT